MILWLLLPSSAGGAPPQAAEQTRSPHGNLNIACQNCHTVYGWKPIRAVPEFDHNQTKFPLRGLHEGVNCVNCHTKMVFANVGSKCADCHADIHRGKMAAACESCHTVRGWKVSVSQINMHMNRFPLTGAHAAAACDDCHKNGALSPFNLMSTECISCHQRDFNGSTNPRHTAAPFFSTTPCQTCHSTDSWTNAKFDHSLTGFILTGSHASPPRLCEDCHKNNNYNLTDASCTACHQTDYNNTTAPPHLQNSKLFPADTVSCTGCHDTVQWSDAKFDHNSTGWPLTGMHTDPPRTCAECHTAANGGYNIANGTCFTCHQTDFNNASNPNHRTNGFPQTCESCHTTTAWSPASFDHDKTAFPLTGQHTVPPRACTDCHVNNNYNLTTATCVSCHLTDFNNASSPNHVQSNFPQTCEVCHSTSAWQPASFDHSKTNFPLTGQHTVPPRACTDCHVNNNYNITDTTCVSCHQTDYNNAKTPVDHPGANMPTTCANCHDTVSWTNGKFDHSSTGWPLTGSHQVPPRTCADCHVNGNYNLSSTTCITCHQTDYNNAKTPVDHPGANFPTTCEGCHDTVSWTDGKFDHASTGWPLTNAHTVPPRACADCHVNGNYNITSTTCVSCHQTDYNNAKTPVDHAGANFPTTCEGCHDTIQWTDGKFDHASTGWALTGLHTVPPRACSDCHVKGNYNLSATTCVTCHLTDYNNTNNPNHAQQGIPQTCEVCHTTAAWQPAQFDHSKSGFPLTGSHTVPPRACTDCHINNNYNITDTSCVSCHQTDYNNAKTPVDHPGANFPTTCATCHDTVQWTDGKFDHSSTGWPLTNAHAVPPRTCADCHVNGNYNITSTTCISCHQTDYNNAKTPVDHVGAKFPTACESCHDTIQWTDGKFDHASTGWALTNSHQVPPRSCADCHTNGNYNITTTTCVSCHQNDYNSAKSPVDHVSAKFPTACESCHDTIQWTDGVFDHASTGWALTNAHTVPPRACSDCHVNGNYNITVTTCVSCHQTDYNNALTPVNHPQANFPLTCDGCHDTIQWTDGKFDHASTGWALTGTHQVPPRVCTDCHVNANYNITVTTCISCHQNDYNNAKSPVDHIGAKFPTTCETCHDTNVWTDGKFDHSSTGWPLTNAHAVPPRACSDCHINGNYNITVTTCVSCHQTDYNNALTPVNHPQANFPTTCDTCHDTIQWTDGKFDHASTGWALTNAHQVPPRTCADCHINGNYNITTTTCVSCHQNDYNTAKSPVDHVAAKFPTACEGCHDTVVWTDGVFNHASTGWALTNSHTVPPRACSDCHVNGNYNITSTTCVSCHQADYNSAKSPVDHVTANFPTTCETCHDTIQWTDGKFDHTATGWALSGSHTVPPRSCADCHINSNYNLTSTACVTCHQTDYNNTNSPPHATAGFPTTCETCHDMVAWTDATFDHSKTSFPLTGSHTVPPRACVDCHVNNNYTTLPTDCYGCHTTDYNNTNNPNHKAAQFPTTCATCHDTKVWTDATFNHTWFPTNHGNANGVCATCHTNPNDYSVFQCTGCHGNNNAANFHHPNVNGYVYNSVNCYQCHKSGGGG